MKTSALGCCGLSCEDCPVFIATANDDNKLRQKTAREWSKLYAGFLGKELKSGDMNCKGCKSKGSLLVGCSNCPIRKCCRENKFVTCADCNEYEKCEILDGFFSYHHQHAKDNLDKIRKLRRDETEN